jgi:hypothetical protein
MAPDVLQRRGPFFTTVMAAILSQDSVTLGGDAEDQFNDKVRDLGTGQEEFGSMN